MGQWCQFIKFLVTPGPLSLILLCTSITNLWHGYMLYGYSGCFRGLDILLFGLFGRVEVVYVVRVTLSYSTLTSNYGMSMKKTFKFILPNRMTFYLWNCSNIVVRLMFNIAMLDMCVCVWQQMCVTVDKLYIVYGQQILQKALDVTCHQSTAWPGGCGSCPW